LQLTGNATISGRITNTNGQPLLGIEVSALVKTYNANGVSLVAERSSVKTDDRGEYRIAGLTPGQYFIFANTAMLAYTAAGGSDRFSGDSPQADRTPGRYTAAYYPGVAGRDKAVTVDIQGGQEQKNVDMSLSRSALYRIRGRLLNPLGIRSTGQAIFSVLPMVSDTVSLPDMSTISLGADGTFELANIPAGNHWVTASVQFSEPPIRDFGRGYALARVVDGDVEGVEITR
jgi:hypothetical protein